MAEPLYLLDTNVLSELRRPKPHGAVLTWFKTLSDAQINIAAITIGEVQAGVERTREQSPSKAAEIEAWLVTLTTTWTIIPMDAAVFRRWAILMHRRSSDLQEDAMIAATAQCHGLQIASRNVQDFARLGVACFDPFRA